MRQILRAREKPQERPSLLRRIIPDGSAQHRIARLQRIDHRALRHLTRDLDLDLTPHPRQRSQMLWKNNPDHDSVCTSTESTAGRSRTMGAQLSPASADAYTCPPVVPKYSPHLSSESTAIASRNTFTSQSLCGRPALSGCHSLPPVTLRSTWSLPSGGKCCASLLMGTT